MMFPKDAADIALHNFMSALTDEHAIEYFSRSEVDQERLGQIAANANQYGFAQTGSGLFLRELPTDTRRGRGGTLIEVLFPRPSDLHVHDRMAEIIKVLSGQGEFYTLKDIHNPQTRHTVPIDPRTDRFEVSPGTQHGFVPAANGLKILVDCSMKYTPAEERCIVPFYDLGKLKITLPAEE
jgi:hypothetical protein